MKFAPVWLALTTFALLALPTAGVAAPRYDLVVEGGRVIDPESGLDGIRNIGLAKGKIAAISSENLIGTRVIHAQGLIVTPGFIDLHSHGQQLPAARMQAFDGVTTALELEAGVLPIASFYDNVAKEGRPINYGASASWAEARQAVMDGQAPEPSLAAFEKAASLPNWSSKIASDAEVRAMSKMIGEGLDQGALGVGFLIGYAPPSGRKEYYELNRLSAERGVGTFTHVRYMSVDEPQSSFEAYQEMVAVAASTGAHMHICHLNSTSLRDAPRVIELISTAQKHGVPLTVEAYPYAAGSTVIGAAMFRGPNWRERLGGAKASDFEYDGQPLDEESFARLQKTDPGALIVIHFLSPGIIPGDQELLDRSVLYAGGAIASDAMPWKVNGETLNGNIWPLPTNAFAHPRSAGTFSRFLRQYVRERKAISLTDAIAKITLVPAKILEGSVPQMRDKGRLRVGADADIVVFDLARIADRATYAHPAQTSTGMRWVIVNGTPVIEDGQLDLRALPGRAIRRPH